MVGHGVHMIFPEHSQVVLNTPLPALQLEPGAIGVVLHVHGDGEAYEVEFFSLDGRSSGVETLLARDLRAAEPEQGLPALNDRRRKDDEDVKLAEQTEFARRGMQSIARSEAAGDWIPADAVIAKLEAKVAAARQRLNRSDR